MRFCETVHMDWSRPGANAARVTPTLQATNLREVGSAIWLGTRFAMVWEQWGRATGNELARAKARAFMDAVTHAQHPVTGNVDIEMRTKIEPLNRFAVNAGRCAWNLMQYANLLDSVPATNP